MLDSWLKCGPLSDFAEPADKVLAIFIFQHETQSVIQTMKQNTHELTHEWIGAPDIRQHKEGIELLQ